MSGNIAIIVIVFAAIFVLALLVALAIVIPNKREENETHATNESAGKWGELAANYHLESLLRNGDYLLPNLLVPLRNGYKTEIDCVLISRKGIFCIEIKKWVGHISGNDSDEYWLQEYDDPYMSDRKHKNPVKQNDGHCAALRRILNNQFEIDNIVLFVDLEDGLGIESECAFTLGGFKQFYQGLDDELDSLQTKNIYQKLLPFVATTEQLDKHKEDIKNRFN